ncbi:MAG: hypothetical protein ACI4P6_03280 [Candidatus Spyradosoma sp.]
MSEEKYLTLYKEQPWDIRKTYDYVFHAKARERVTDLLRAIAKRGDPERNLDIGRCRRHDAIFVNGGRGVGKTVFLTQADTFLSDDEKKDTLGLYFLPVLEPSLLDDTVSSPERFISVAVAQVNEVLEEKHPYAGSEEDVKSGLLDEYGKAYRDVAEAISGVQSFTKGDGNGADDLFSMQSVISLERALHRFFGVACRMLKVKALILRFDDVDMACGIGFCVLEAIRKYLATPYVVPMVSGDLSLYQRLCENHFREKLKDKGNGDAGDKKAESLAESYLQKVLPADRRVELHALGYGMASGEIQIDGVRLVDGKATTEMEWTDVKACLDFYAFGAMKNERYRRDALPDSVEHKECFRGAENLSIPLELPSTRAAFMFLSRIFDVLKDWKEKGGENGFSWENFRIFHAAARDVTEHVAAFEARQEVARVNALASSNGALSVSEIFRNLDFKKAEPMLEEEDERLFVSRRRSNRHYQELKTFLEQSISKDKENEKERYKRFLWDLFLTNEYDSAGKLKPSILFGGRFFEFVLSSIYFGEADEGAEALMVKQLISKVPFNSDLENSFSFEKRSEEESPEKDLSDEGLSGEELSKGGANNGAKGGDEIFYLIGNRLRLRAEENFKKLLDSFLIAKIAKRYFDNLKSIHDDFVLKIGRVKKLELDLAKLKDGKAALERTISEVDSDLEKQKAILEEKILKNKADVEERKKDFLALEKTISEKSADLEKSASEKSALEKKIQKNNADLKSLDRKKDGLEEKIWKTSSDLDGLKNGETVLEGKIQKNKAEMEKLEKEKDDLEEEVLTGELGLVDMNNKMSVLEREIQKNKEDMRTLEKEKTALDKMLQKRKSALEKLANGEPVLKKQANENSALEEKIQKNKAEVEKWENEKVFLEKTIQEKKLLQDGPRKKKIILEKTIQKWFLDLKKHEKEKEILEKKFWGKDADLKKLNNQKVSVEKKIKEKKAIVEKQEDTNEVLWKRIQEERTALLESRISKNDVETKIRKAVSLLETLEKDKVDLEEKILKNKENLETQKKKKSDLEDEIREKSNLEDKILKESALMSFIRRCSAALLNAVAEVETQEPEYVSRNIATEASDIEKISRKDLAWRRNVHPLLNKDSLTYLVAKNPLIFSALKVYESLNEEKQKEYLESETEKIFKEIFPTFEKIFVDINPVSASSATLQKDGKRPRR